MQMFELQVFWYKLRLLFNRKSCGDCKHAGVFYSGNGFNEHYEAEFECKKEKLILPELETYEDIFGEVNFEFATVCPLYEYEKYAEIYEDKDI